MSKTLRLDSKLKYPITITKLYKKPHEDVAKGEILISYKYNWMLKVGDPFDKEWEEQQTSVDDVQSISEGKFEAWKVREGQVVEAPLDFAVIEETCPHSVQFASMCAMCGKDMTEVDYNTPSGDTGRATINMIHDQTNLKVSEEVAARSEEALQRRLLKQKKLSLVVDLDQTIIQACIEPTIGEWQNDPTSPNYEAVKEVKKFQLEDGTRSSLSGLWYYIKLRPGLQQFMESISQIYELHVYTMGTRAYAVNIAKLVDPDKKFFGDRIISRDENGSVTQKNLGRLFPLDTKMVCIIDDRSDVWLNNRPNLIKVVPFDFFIGVGDINSALLPKQDQLPAITQPAQKEEPKKIDDAQASITEVTAEIPAPVDGETTKAVPLTEALVRMGAGSEQAAVEQEQNLEKQLTERPLQALQEKLDKEDAEEEAAAAEAIKNGETVPAHPHQRHNLLSDDDQELMYVERHLTAVHRSFYEEYEAALVNAHGGRVAQLKPGQNKKVSIKKDSADLKIVPDVGQVMGRLKAPVLAGCTIVMSGLVQLGADAMTTELGKQVAMFGPEIVNKISKKVTHLVCSSNRTRTQKVRQAAKFPHIKIVDYRWLTASMSRWEKADETPYLVQIHDRDRIREDDFDSNHSPSDSDDTSTSDLDEAQPAASQEEIVDDEGVMPDEYEEGTSPIENLNEGFKWGDLDDELNEFMASGSDDSDDDSDSSLRSDSSEASTGSKKSRSRKKRGHEKITTDDDESDADGPSTLAKKQRMANERRTGLGNVKTPISVGSESSLPTPGVTGDEQDEGKLAGTDDDDDTFDDDLEADLMAEFEKEEVEGDGEG